VVQTLDAADQMLCLTSPRQVVLTYMCRPASCSSCRMNLNTQTQLPMPGHCCLL
jgi:succinate dehydrogenase/fumarate reductase-like Fe-S protein